MPMKATLTLLMLLHSVISQIPSPCPDVLVYEPRNSELDRWYAVVTLSSTHQLKGIWLKITLDRPAELLGNIFGDATTDDNQEFLIRSKNYILQAGKTVTVRFFVKFNAASIIPSIIEINLNGQLICLSSNPQTTERTSTSRTSTTSNHRTVNPSGERTRQTTEKLIAINFSNSSNSRPHNFRPSQDNNSRAPNSSNSFNTDLDVITANIMSNSSNNNHRPSSSFSNSDEDLYNYRPSSSNNFFNTGSDNYNRPVDTGISLGTNSQTDFEEFFSGDYPAIINRPPSNPIRQNIGVNTQCGKVATHATPLISYGQNTMPGQWPWHAALYHSKGIQLMYTCGGTLISANHILTAAHCVTRPRTNRPINPQNLLVYLGKYNLNKFGTEIQDKEVVDIYVHPEYNYSVFYNDISILRLGEPAQFTNYVRPICLWQGSDDLNEIEGHYGTVVGWGFDHNRELSTSLMQAQMPIVSTSKCIYSNREFFSQFTSENSFCAGFKNRTSVCNGDSGGGMVFPKKDTSGSKTIWQIRGIVSVGVALQGQAVCDPSQYIVFTDVAKYLEWIQQILVKS
ncbi:hypothetical protein WA026_011092 [Henosepilachna vigintioctopunctata]|uniref:Peptidase S1 domain-containing protein n=1 Tax=Henosepilachna vigintioctopunctata TaxID=420089 RepID=A0AAW1U5Y0_9CUCU